MSIAKYSKSLKRTLGMNLAGNTGHDFASTSDCGRGGEVTRCLSPPALGCCDEEGIAHAGLGASSWMADRGSQVSDQVFACSMAFHHVCPQLACGAAVA
jgi:hypothetical protein